MKKILLVVLLFPLLCAAQNGSAIYSAQSEFQANPRSYNMQYQFDYSIDLDVNIQGTPGGDGLIHFNSADGTIAITDWNLLFNGERELDYMGFDEFHQAILFPDGKIILYGVKKEPHPNNPDIDIDVRVAEVIETNGIMGEHISNPVGNYTPSMTEVERNQIFQSVLDTAIKRQKRAHSIYGPQLSHLIEIENGSVDYWLAEHRVGIVFSPEAISIYPFGIPLLFKDHNRRENRICTKTVFNTEVRTMMFTVKRVTHLANNPIRIDGQGYEKQIVAQFNVDGQGFTDEHNGAMQEVMQIMQDSNLSKREKEIRIKRLMNERLQNNNDY